MPNQCGSFLELFETLEHCLIVETNLSLSLVNKCLRAWLVHDLINELNPNSCTCQATLPIWPPQTQTQAKLKSHNGDFLFSLFRFLMDVMYAPQLIPNKQKGAIHYIMIYKYFLKKSDFHLTRIKKAV
jgi:hypothetical protein